MRNRLWEKLRRGCDRRGDRGWGGGVYCAGPAALFGGGAGTAGGGTVTGPLAWSAVGLFVVAAVWLAWRWGSGGRKAGPASSAAGAVRATDVTAEAAAPVIHEDAAEPEREKELVSV